MWRIVGEFEKNKRTALCVDSKNVVEIFDKVKARISNNIEGFKSIRELSISYPKVKLFYVNRK